MPDCDEMYNIVCKDRFDKIDAALEKINDNLSGNPGVLPRLAVVEEQTKSNTERITKAEKSVIGKIIALFR